MREIIKQSDRQDVGAGFSVQFRAELPDADGLAETRCKWLPHFPRGRERRKVNMAKYQAIAMTFVESVIPLGVKGTVITHE